MNFTNKIPCLECLVYVLCKNKRKVKCHNLYYYISITRPSDFQMKEILPQLETVIDSEPPKDSKSIGIAFLRTDSKGVDGWGIMSDYWN